MAHIKNEDFYLYTGLTANGDECYEAFTYLTSTGIQFRHLHYGDPAQHESVTTSISTWFPEQNLILKFPLVHYTEVYEFEDNLPKKISIVVGIDDIKTTDWNSLFNFAGTPSGG
jgi:hypothetical protein